MKMIRVWVVLTLMISACQKSEQVSELTGKQVTYALQQPRNILFQGQ